MARIACIVHGKVSRREYLLAELNDALGVQHDFKVFTTTHQGEAISLTEQAVSKGFTHLLAIGGDGTVNEVVNGIMNSRTTLDAASREQIRLGILPRGTGNDFVKSLRIPQTLQGICSSITEDQYTAVDLGRVTFRSQQQKETIRYFANITDLGLGGVVAERLSRSTKWLGKTLTYQLSIIRTFLSYKHQAVSVEADTWRHQGRIMNLIIANGQYFGSGLGIAPDASLTDGFFDVIVVGEISVLDYLKNLPNLRKRLPIKHPEVTYQRAADLTIESPETMLPIDMDGEFIGYAPMKVKMIRSALKILTLPS